MKPDPRIDSYIARSQPALQPILATIRDRVRAVVPEVEETLRWGAPAYLLDGRILLITAAFKAHAALNFWRGQELAVDPVGGAMGQFGKLRSIADLPSQAELDRLIAEAARLSRSPPSARKPKHSPKPPPELHPDFASALEASPKARDTLDSLPPGARRDYLEWVAEAKRDSTRSQRIATAIQWLAEGKRRNWKYETC